MLTNYHTHTTRCHHAFGEDEEYVLSAIRAGYDALGFSDHAPYFYNDGYVSYYKMTPEEAPEYISSVLALKEKYKDKIKIHLGLEAEYYPEIFEKSLDLWRKLGVEYVILGQHYVYKETKTREDAAAIPSSAEKLIRYTDRCIEAMETGKFSYIAHPDILNYVGDDEALYRREAKRLVECAVRCNVPLEINLLGLKEGRNYPNKIFWEVAAPLNPTVIIGTDAHVPHVLENTELRRAAVEFADSYGLNLIEKLEFKPI